MVNEFHNVAAATSKRLVSCIALLLITTLAINVLSAFIRHQEAGLGCVDVQACYGVVGRIEAATSQVEAAARALTPAEAVKRTHRAMATLLVLLVVLVVYFTRSDGASRRVQLRGADQFLPHMLVAVVLLLALIGPASYRKSLPAVATFNLLGGVGLLAIGYWLWMTVRTPRPLAPVGPAGWWVLGVLCAQVAIGAWTSANFAGMACGGMFCTERSGAGGNALSSFWIWRELTIEAGRVVVDDTQRIIQFVHRLGALATTIAIGWLGIRWLLAPTPHRGLGWALLILLAVQVGLGLSVGLSGPSLGVVLAHNLVASLLVLAVLRAVYLGGGDRSSTRAGA